jgi:hypothetical protein
VRRLTLLLATPCLALGLIAHAADTDSKVSPLNQRIVSFCKKSIGKKIGDGQCADLAYQALLLSGAESPDDFKDNPKPGDYVWGDFLYCHKVEGSKHLEKGDRNAVKPGDIIQMRDVVIEHEEDSGEYVTRETIDADHHTAVVSSVSADGLTYQVIEQNANEVPTVTAGALHLEDMKHGYILVYRAVPDSDLGDDPSRERQLQGDSANRNRRARTHHRPRHHRKS